MTQRERKTTSGLSYGVVREITGSRNQDSTVIFPWNCICINKNVPSLHARIQQDRTSCAFKSKRVKITVYHTFTFPLVLCLSFPPIMTSKLIEPFQNKQPKIINFHTNPD